FLSVTPWAGAEVDRRDSLGYSPEERMMRLTRIVFSMLTSGLVVLGSLLMVAPGRSLATTGPTQILTDSRYHVQSKVMILYVGQYVLKSAATAARIRGGAMGIEISDRGFLYGIAQFYSYDEQGHQSTWVGTLYNFHLTKAKVMIFDISGPSGGELLGRLFLA